MMKTNYYTEIPDHVPPELVRDYPLSLRGVIYENPYETIIPKIHEGPPVFMAPTGYLSIAPGWVFRRAEDIKQVFFDTEHFIKKGNTNFAAMLGEDWDAIPTELDPPRHTAVRRALNPLFLPARMARLDDMVRQRAQEYIGAFRSRGHCDFVAEFAIPYPVSIFLDLLGLPQDRMKQFLEWETSILHAVGVPERAAGVRAVKAYLLEAIDERRKRPTDDLISTALTLVVDGELLSPIEVFGHCFNLYIGGLDTVSANLGLHFRHLAENVEQQNQLRRDPSLIRPAMNELLRAYAAVSNARICAKEIEIAGVTLKPGDKVLLPTPLAARDPEEYDEPNAIRFDRGGQNITFGYGIHRCLGIHLAQREIQTALEQMLSSLPEFRIEPGARIPFRTGSILQLNELPIVWG